MKYSRRSSVIVNTVPIYHKQAKILAYAADKAVLLHQFDENRISTLTAHTDTVTVLRFHPTDPFKLVTAGLDGKIIEWDAQTGCQIRKTETRLPIFFLYDNFVGHEIKSKYVLRKYKPGFKDYTTIMEDTSPIQCSVGGSDTFVASISPTSLSIYWDCLGVTSNFTISNSRSGDERRFFTSVAAHPSEFIVATGNRLGEIFIWYGLATSSSAMDSIDWMSMLYPDPDVMSEDDEQPQENDQTGDSNQATSIPIRLQSPESEFDKVRQVVLERYQKQQSLSYCPVHPSRIHKNILHWHCQLVESLVFTPTGSHLLSGGLERVIVKWDMTECLGGPRQRRFLPRLSAPIYRIDSPGGASEDTIVITLANNEFHVVSGALNIIHTQQGFAQFPAIWHRLPHSPVDYTVPHNLQLLGVPSKTSAVPHSPVILTNGAMGDLQLLRLDTNRLEVQKLEVTRQSIVPRPYGSKISVAYVEVLLIATASSSRHGSWLVTYERMVPQRLKSLDDHARITWWNQTSDNKDNSSFPRFEPLETLSLSHLNCSATDMGFVEDSNLYVYLLLADTRLLVWRSNLESVHTSHVSRWTLQSCRVLCHQQVNRVNCIPHLTILPNPSDVQPVALLQTGLTLTAFLWSSAAVEPGQLTILSKFTFLDLPELSGQCEPRVISDKACVVALPHEKTSVSHAVAVSLRVTSPTEDNPKRTTTSLSALVLDYPAEQPERCTIGLASLFQDIHPVCCKAHPWKPWLAVGLTNGKALVITIERTENQQVEFRTMYSLPAVPAHPLCDRRASHRGGANQRRSNREAIDRPTTKLLTLEFIPSIGESESDIKLLSLVETTLGRERGRRDLVVYGASPGAPVQVISNSSVNTKASANVLRLVDPAVVPRLPAVPKPLAGRKRAAHEMDAQIEDALRQVSQYPLVTAPAPEQLLRQLMSKPNHTD